MRAAVLMIVVGVCSSTASAEEFPDPPARAIEISAVKKGKTWFCYEAIESTGVKFSECRRTRRECKERRSFRNETKQLPTVFQLCMEYGKALVTTIRFKGTDTYGAAAFQYIDDCENTRAAVAKLGHTEVSSCTVIGKL